MKILTLRKSLGFEESSNEQTGFKKVENYRSAERKCKILRVSPSVLGLVLRKKLFLFDNFRFPLVSIKMSMFSEFLDPENLETLNKPGFIFTLEFFEKNSIKFIIPLSSKSIYFSTVKVLSR